MTHYGVTWERRRYDGSTASAVAEPECEGKNEGAFANVAIQRVEWSIPSGEGFVEVPTKGEGEYVCVNDSKNLGQEVKVSRKTTDGKEFFDAVVQPRGGGHPITGYSLGDIIRIESSVPNLLAVGFVDLGIF